MTRTAMTSWFQRRPSRTYADVRIFKGTAWQAAGWRAPERPKPRAEAPSRRHVFTLLFADYFIDLFVYCVFAFAAAEWAKRGPACRRRTGSRSRPNAGLAGDRARFGVPPPSSEWQRFAALPGSRRAECSLKLRARDRCHLGRPSVDCDLDAARIRPPCSSRSWEIPTTASDMHCRGAPVTTDLNEIQLQHMPPTIQLMTCAPRALDQRSWGDQTIISTTYISTIISLETKAVVWESSLCL